MVRYTYGPHTSTCHTGHATSFTIFICISSAFLFLKNAHYAGCIMVALGDIKVGIRLKGKASM
jgi:hypothetical protein